MFRQGEFIIFGVFLYIMKSNRKMIYENLIHTTQIHLILLWYLLTRDILYLLLLIEEGFKNMTNLGIWLNLQWPLVLS